MLTSLLGIAGICLLFAGGELAVRGSVSLARRLSAPPLLVGIVVVGFMTSMPELLVSLRAVTAGNATLAVGNVVGSDIVNLALVLGISALVSPIVARRVRARRDALTMIAALLLLAGFAAVGAVGRWQGLVMVLGLVAYVAWSYRTDSRAATPEGRLHVAEALAADALPPSEPVWLVVALVLGGLALLLVGAAWVVTAATAAARALGLSEAAIALTVVSLGTSLPELAAAIASARHGHSELVIGNVIGSNIFNVLGILGICAFVRPLPIAGAMLLLDLPILIATSVALMPVFAGRVGLRRWVGGAMCAAYVAYFGLRFLV
jgi:cation:H+ antiporter